MATFLAQFSPFFQDFRHFLVSARRKFGLNGLARFLLEVCRVRGFVRYMDDVVWWTDDRAAAKVALDAARFHLAETLCLEMKLPVRLGRSRDGLNFCGFRILPGSLLLSRRRRHRYSTLRKQAERAWQEGHIDAQGLQGAYASALALTIHADAAAWRREQLRRQPLEPALEALA
jgi:RNA-directed DNA polymerase